MINKNKRTYTWLTLPITILIIIGCSFLSSTETNPPPTTTPTEAGGLVPSEPDLKKNLCDGLKGSLEMLLLVGPSDAVGLEPHAVGEIPFETVAESNNFKVEGGGPLEYYEEVLEAEWGTFTVKFETDTIISGTCTSTEAGGSLNLNIQAIGDQMVEVRAEGFQMDYPWSGTPELGVTFPVEEGATQEGEGWILLLHIRQ